MGKLLDASGSWRNLVILGVILDIILVWLNQVCFLGELQFLVFLAFFAYCGYISAKKLGVGMLYAGFRTATVYLGVLFGSLLVKWVAALVAIIFYGNAESLSIWSAIEKILMISHPYFVCPVVFGAIVNIGVGALGAILAKISKQDKSPAGKHKKK
jgi:hypothetical protein